MSNSFVYSGQNPYGNVDLSTLVGAPNPDSGLYKIFNDVDNFGNNFANAELAVPASDTVAGDYQPGSVQLYQIANAGFASGALLRGEVGTGVWQEYGIASGDLNKVLTVTSDTVGTETFAWTAPAYVPFSWTVVSGTTVSMTANNGYIASNVAQTTLTLPATAKVGDTFKVYARTVAGWTITAGSSGQTIQVGDQTSGPDVASISSTAIGQAIELVCVDDSSAGNEVFGVVTGTGSNITW